MIKPTVEIKCTITFSDLIDYLMAATGKDYSTIENSLPDWIYEDNYHLSADGVGNSAGEWFKPLGEWLTNNNIERIYMYHD
jgi:hypothetical protein